MGNSSSRQRRQETSAPPQRLPEAEGEAVEAPRSVRRSVSNFVRRRTPSLSKSRIRPQSWRRQPPTENEGDRTLDSVQERPKDETPAPGGPSGDSTPRPLNVSDSSSIVVQSMPPPPPAPLPLDDPTTTLAASSRQPEPDLTLSATPEESTTEAPSAGPQIAPTAAGSTAPNRQFPPPGTIVVVQGVVHTTDGLGRLPESSTANGSTTPETRPRAMSTPRPSTPAGAESRSRLSTLLSRPRPTSALSLDQPSTLSHSSLSPPSSTSLSSPQSPASVSDAPTSVDTDTATTTPSNTTNSTLASSSVDVLGTLLSVAAAATAASLLTNSSEPMQSSGLATSRTPSQPTSPQENRADRMRNAWGSLRERFGLRNNSNATQPAATDARERMISEMARAFNLGLGLDGSEAAPRNDDTASRPTSPPAVETPPTSQVPAEGSFERFLIDLQVDLRVALREHDAAITSSMLSPPPAPASLRTEMPDVPDDVTTTQSHSMEEDDDEEQEAALEGESSQVQPHDSTRLNWWRYYRFPSMPAPPSAPGATGSTIPSLSRPSPLQEPMSTDSAPAPPAPTSTSTALPNATPADTTVVPIIVIGLQSVNVNANWTPRTSPPTIPQPAAARPAGQSSTSLAADHGSHDPHTPMAPTPTADEPPTPFLPSLSGLDDDDEEGEEVEAALSFAPPPIVEPENASPPVAPSVTGSGARTFLIYVIGGYYPPDHTMVTGEFNNFDSFDALMDLAELLGQVKPPTVSQDEINRSGLEVIKSTQLGEWEAAGRISNNCVERCLICLDEYAEEDEVRVLSCRHGFHKGCVDMWMQTGKNNCPACRSTGVAPSEAPAATATA